MSAADLERVRGLQSQDQGLAAVTTTRADGTVQASVVNCGLLDHPKTGETVAGFTTRGSTVKLAHLRQRPSVTVVFRRGWQWATVEGTAQIIGPDDPADWIDDEEFTRLLRDVFTAAGGTHDNWDTYDRVMREERRAVVLITPARVYGVG